MIPEAVKLKLDPARWIEDSIWNSGVSLAESIEGFLANGTPPTPGEHLFLSGLAEVLASNFTRQIAKLARGGSCGNPDPVVSVGLNTLEGKLYAGSVLKANATKVVSRIKASPDVAKDGVSSLIAAVHTYCACVGCRTVLHFSMGDHLSALSPAKLRFIIPNRAMFESWFAARMNKTGIPDLAGICGKCKYNCLQCKAMGTMTFEAEEVMEMLAEAVCRKCASSLLVNVKAPRPQRRELAALHRKSFLDL